MRTEMERLERTDWLMVKVVFPMIFGGGLTAWVLFLLYEAIGKL